MQYKTFGTAPEAVTQTIRVTALLGKQVGAGEAPTEETY